MPRTGEQSSRFCPKQLQSGTSCLTLEDGEDARQTGTGTLPTHRLKNGRKQRGFQTLRAGFPQICRQSAAVQIVPGKVHCVAAGKDPAVPVCSVWHFLPGRALPGPGQRWHLGLWVTPAEREQGMGAEAALLSNGPTLPPTPQPGGKAALRGQGMGVSHEGWARLLSAVNLHKAFDVGGSDW